MTDDTIEKSKMIGNRRLCRSFVTSGSCAEISMLYAGDCLHAARNDFYGEETAQNSP